MTKFRELSDDSLNYLKNNLKDFYVPYRDSLDLPKTATFGLEIEFNIDGYDEKYIKTLHKEGYYDPAFEFMNSIGIPKLGTISHEQDNIIELITPVLTDNNWDVIKYVLDFLIRNGAYNAGRCGSHVHVGMQLIDNNIDKWKIFLRLWALYEDEIITFTNGEYYLSRKNIDTQARSAKEHIYKYINAHSTKECTYKDINIEQITPYALRCKGYALKLPYSFDFLVSANKKCNYFEENKDFTIEFRTPNFTINPIIWQNNINFFTKMMIASNDDNFDIELLKHYEKPESLESYLSNKDRRVFELVDFVFNNDFDKYCFLRQYYKDFNEPKKEDPMLKSSKFWK